MVRVADGEEIDIDQAPSGFPRMLSPSISRPSSSSRYQTSPLLTSEKAITKLAKASPHRSVAGDMRCSRTQNGKPCSGVVGNIAAGLRGNMNAWKESISRMREPDAALDL